MSSNQQLLKACREGDLSAVNAIFDQALKAKASRTASADAPTSSSASSAQQDHQDSEGPDASYADEETGTSLLMAAAASGNQDLVAFLLEQGAPWNALDRKGLCAGQYALEKGHQHIVDQLVAAGVQAELLFAAIEKRSLLGQAQAQDNNANYLSSRIRYEGDDLLDDQSRGVMMAWETPIMEMHADMLCHTKGDVLNIGFGMGIIDGAIQKRQPKSHTIIEAHPQVYERMIREGWDKKPNVRVVFGRWQDVIDSLGQFDAIYFDTFDDVVHMNEFHVHLPKLLRRGGVYSFFNGICTENIFFQGVACEVLRLQLQELGFNAIFAPVEIDSGDEETWKNTQFRYFSQSTYYCPIVTWINQGDHDTAATGEDAMDSSEQQDRTASSAAATSS